MHHIRQEIRRLREIGLDFEQVELLILDEVEKEQNREAFQRLLPAHAPNREYIVACPGHYFDNCRVNISALLTTTHEAVVTDGLTTARIAPSALRPVALPPTETSEGEEDAR